MNELPLLSWAVTLLLLQGLMGAFDTLYHHELTVALPQRAGARRELAIHALRACLYALLFAGMAHFAFHGLWALVVAAVVAVEVLLTLWDFVVEDSSRKLPASERVTHTLLAINGGALFAFYGAQLVQWSALPTALRPLDLGWQGWVLSLFAVGVGLSGLRDALAARALRNRAPMPNPFTRIAHRRVLVTGGTGFIGQALVSQLLEAGHAVTVLTRDPLRAAHEFHGRSRCIRSLDELSAGDVHDAVVNLAGAPVVGPRWSGSRKARLLQSRVGTTEALLGWARRVVRPPAVWVQASAIGFYGVRDPDEVLSEESSAGAGFMTELCVKWEQAAAQAGGLGIRQVVLRLGLVFGPGGALAALLMPVRFGAGARLGSGRQVMSWVHRDDVLRLIARALDDVAMQGVYNAVAPETVSQQEFISTAGKVLNRPVFLWVPAAPLRLLGGEMASLFVDGQCVRPSRLIRDGFEFRHPTLVSALSDAG